MNESINNLESHMILGYFETCRSTFFVKMGLVLRFEAGDVAVHKAISEAAAQVANSLDDQLATKALASIGPEVIDNLKEDAINGLILASWIVFEQVIKDVIVPDYAASPLMYQADFHRSVFNFSAQEKDEIALFYHLCNAIMHYNGAYHAYRTVDVIYEGVHFKSSGHFGEKIIISPKLALSVARDIEKYAMSAWSRVAQPSGRK